LEEVGIVELTVCLMDVDKDPTTADDILAEEFV